MTTGVMMFAIGDGIDYLALAAWNAHRVHRYLDLPVCVVTDQDPVDPVFDHVVRVSAGKVLSARYFTDQDGLVKWHNHNRCDALDLSPYDRTLLIDADYVISSDRLRTVTDHGADIMCFRTAYDVATGQDLVELNQFGAHRMPMWWATVIVFSKTAVTRLVFDAWRMVRDNWRHYRDIYGIRDPLFRNDYAMTIALGIVSGHTLKVNAIPWRMPTILPGTEVKLNSAPWGEFQIFYRNTDDRLRTQNVFDSTDCHVMAKSQLTKIVSDAA